MSILFLFVFVLFFSFHPFSCTFCSLYSVKLLQNQTFCHVFVCFFQKMCFLFILCSTIYKTAGLCFSFVIFYNFCIFLSNFTAN